MRLFREKVKVLKTDKDRDLLLAHLISTATRDGWGSQMGVKILDKVCHKAREKGIRAIQHRLKHRKDAPIQNVKRRFIWGEVRYGRLREPKV